MGFWDKIKRGYRNIDRLVGGYLPGGVKPGKTSGGSSTPSIPSTSTPSISTPSTPSTSGGGSSSSGGSSGRSSSGSKTVPSNFIGPLQPGTIREEAPKVYSGPVQPGTTPTQKKEFRRTGRISSGGGGSSGGGSSGSSQPKNVPYDFVGPLQPGTIREKVYAPDTQVNNFIQSEKAKDILIKRDQANKTRQLLNLRKQKPNPIIDMYYKNAESRANSTQTPRLQDIQSMIDRRGTIHTILNMGQEPKLSSQDVNYATRKIIEKKYQSTKQEDFNKDIKKLISQETSKINISKYQNRINSGEDYDFVISEYKENIASANQRIQNYTIGWEKNWQERIGKYIQKAGDKIIYSTQIKTSAKDTQSKVGSYFTKGAVFGGTTTAGIMGVGAISTAAATVLSGVGLVAGAGYAVYSYGKAGFTGNKIYKEALKKGFSKKEAVQLSLVGGATDIAPASYGALGATAGGAVVYGGVRVSANLLKTGSLRGITKADQKIINKVTSRKNAFKTEIVKGKVKDSVMGRYYAVENKAELLGLKKGSSSIRSYKTTINKVGLSGREIRAVNKLNYRATTHQIIQQRGKLITGVEGTKTRTGYLLRINKDINSLGFISGKNSGGMFRGGRMVIAEQGKFSTISAEILLAKGKVKISRNLRGEVSKGVSIKVLEANYKNGKLIKTSTDPLLSKSKFGVVSRLKQIDIRTQPQTKDIFDLSLSKTYQDSFGGSIGGRMFPKFIIKSPPKSSSSKLGGGMLKMVSPKPSSDMPIIAPAKPSTQTLSNIAGVKGYGGGNIQRVAGISTGVISGMGSGQGYKSVNVDRSVLSNFMAGFKVQKSEKAQASQYAGSRMYERTTGGTSPKTSPKLIQVLKVDTKLRVGTINAVIPDVKTRRKSRGRGKSQTIVTPAMIQKSIQKPKVDTIQKSKVTQVRKVKLKQLQIYERPTPFTYGPTPPFIPYNISTRIPFPFPPLGAGGGAGLKLGNVRPQKSPTRYTPSFKALFFKIKGKAPKGIATGIRFRPITMGFSFGGKRKVIRVRRIRI